MYNAFYLATVACYAQGMALIREASKEFNYKVHLAEVARIWKGGCIIRSKLLTRSKRPSRRTPDLDNLLLDASFSGMANANHPDLRRVVQLAAERRSGDLPGRNAGLHRQLPQRISPGQSAASSARQLWGAHLQAPRPRRNLPRRVGGITRRGVRG